eukprot:7929575-Alexandrium_andersonii.AAC.1
MTAKVSQVAFFDSDLRHGVLGGRVGWSAAPTNSYGHSPTGPAQRGGFESVETRRLQTCSQV